MAGLLKQLQPRLAMIFGCAILALAGMAGLLAWLGTVPPRGELRHVTGQVQELVLRDARAGAFQITLASGGGIQTFEFRNAHRLVTLLALQGIPEGRQIDGAVTAALAYYPFGRWKKVVDITLGQENVLSYEDVASLAAREAVKNRNTAIGLAVLGAFLISLGAAAWIARRGSGQLPVLYPAKTIAVLTWLTLYGAAVVVILTEPAATRRAFGAEALHLPIEYVVPGVLALLFLPMWPGFIDLAAVLTGQAMRKAKGDELRPAFEMQSTLASNNHSETGAANRALWPFAYLLLLCAAWIVYAAIAGI